LLFGRPLDVGAVHRRDRQIDGQLDGVIGPGQTLRALHLLGELAEPALQIVRVSEQTAESTSFHGSYGSWRPVAAFGDSDARHGRRASTAMVPPRRAMPAPRSGSEPGTV